MGAENGVLTDVLHSVLGHGTVDASASIAKGEPSYIFLYFFSLIPREKG